ncbi:MAG: hypothetical protein C4345_11920, partial [Chloroflexota bacterium]
MHRALGCATLDSRRLMPVAIVVLPNDLTKLPAKLPHACERYIAEDGKFLWCGTAERLAQMRDAQCGRLGICGSKIRFR